MNLKIIITVLFLITFEENSFTSGCRPEVCRRRRQIIEESEVLLELQGCSGKTKPWVAQLAYCVNQSTFEVANGMKDWYLTTYQTCTKRCVDVKAGTSNAVDIAYCTDCFVARSREIENRFPTVNFTDATHKCVSDFVQPSLSQALPTVTSMSQNENQGSGRVKLPEQRPADSWYSLSVKLPCKPPLFQYFGANCINSYADDARSRDFVLAQNKLITDDGITFIVRFSDTCRFNLSDIEIVWDKSVPGFAYPQFSSLPSSLNPVKPEQGNLYFDSEAYQSYERTVERDIEGTTTDSRPKRPSSGLAPQLGISMPCKVKGFSVFNENGDRLVTKSKGNRYLLEPTAVKLRGKRLERETVQNYNSLNFSLDYGYEETGCIFSSNEIKTTVSPPDNWLDSGDKLICHTCTNAASESECTGETVCQKGEICQSEIRQLSVFPNKISITKSCKWAKACENNWMNNNRRQCNPGKQSSVCRCCCTSDRCNKDGYHCT